MSRPYLNVVVLLGWLAKDPQAIPGGRGCYITLAIPVPGGHQVKRATMYHRVTVWGGTARACMEYLSKGDQVIIHGEFISRTYSKSDGKVYNDKFIQARPGGVLFVITKGKRRVASPLPDSPEIDHDPLPIEVSEAPFPIQEYEYEWEEEDEDPHQP